MASTAKIDPRYPGTIVRRAFLAEAFLNLCSIPILTHPRAILSTLILHPDQVNDTSVLFAQLFGALVVGALVPPLALGARNTPAAVQSRPAVYIMLGLGEAIILPLLWREWLNGTGALSSRAAFAAMAMLGPPLLWRAYVLFIRPEWFGRVLDDKTA